MIDTASTAFLPDDTLEQEFRNTKISPSFDGICDFTTAPSEAHKNYEQGFETRRDPDSYNGIYAPYHGYTRRWRHA